MDDSVEIWNSVLAKSMSYDLTRISRRDYLERTFKSVCSSEQVKEIVDGNPLKTLPIAKIDKLAKAEIKSSRNQSSIASFIAGIPGGVFMGITIPADILQFLAVQLRLAQKLAYLYGYPDLLDENGKLSEMGSSTLTVFIGIMSGVGVTNEVINTVSRRLAQRVLTELPKKALTKTTIYPIVKRIAALLGVKLTKQSFAKSLSKAIPLLGGVISGGITFVSLNQAGNKLQKQLKENADLFINAGSSDTAESDVEDAEVVDE